MSKGKGRGKRNRGKDKATNKNENRDRDRDSDRKEDMYMNEDGNENVDEIQGQGQDQNQDPNENEMQNRNQNQNENHDQDKGKGKAPVVDTSPTLTSTNPSLLSSSIPSGRISELRSESSYGSGNSYMDSRTKTVRVEAAEKLKPKAKALKLSELMRETEGHADTMSPAFRATEYTTVNFGGPGQLRLITFIKRGQGVKWDPAAFLPSSYVKRYLGEELPQNDPVADIHVTEEDRRRWYSDKYLESEGF